MGFDSLREWLRWAFWGFVYFTTMVVAYVVFWSLSVEARIRWCLLAVIAIGIAVDVIHKTRPQPAPTPRPRH